MKDLRGAVYILGLRKGILLCIKRTFSQSQDFIHTPQTCQVTDDGLVAVTGLMVVYFLVELVFILPSHYILKPKGE